MSTTNFAILASATALLGASLAACSEESAEPETTQSPSEQGQAPPGTMPMGAQGDMQQLRVNCPMVVQGTDVAVSDTDDGVALTFTTDQGDVDDLRARVQHMGQMYEMHRGGGYHMMWRHMGDGHMGGGGMGGGMGMGPMPGANADVSDVDGGARLELTPADPSELDALRERVHAQQERMQSGQCWMWQQQGE